MAKAKQSKDSSPAQQILDSAPVKDPSRNTLKGFIETAEKANIVPTDLQRSAVNGVYASVTGITTTIALMALNDPDFEAVYNDLKKKLTGKR